MKLLPILLMNVVLVTGGIVIYDQMRTDAPETTFVTADSPGDMLGEPSAGDGETRPLLRAHGTDPRVLARLAALEEKLGAGTPPAGIDSATEGPGEKPADGMAAPELPIDEEQPSKDDVRRFRKMMDAADQLRRDERERERLARALERLELNLDEEQQGKLLTATRDYRRKVGEVWRNAFQAGGGDREQARETARQGMETLREEFAITINKFLPSGDAQKIIENAAQIGGRGFGDIRMGGSRARSVRGTGGGGR